ncbi:hypothetical protein QFC22_006083 [Naganishia vaughanmartiniae]|uniref:Uncharacterized protein n=1 Tax=Naganishia vaughanmartiniae TaxID=1424756 RepID=A0ACC2WNB9_9TREE|nr:hypothetical protein QFC22_006083 [Naganishia vaughanmartiniae]
MRFPRMERFEVSVTMQDELEMNFIDALQQDSLQGITLDVAYFIAGCHHALSYANVFRLSKDGHATVSPILVPTQDRLERLFETFKTSCKQLCELQVTVTGCFSMYDRGEVFDLLNFRMTKGSAEYDDEVLYEVNQEGIDLIAGMMQKRLAEIAPRDDNSENGSDEESDEDEGSDDGEESTEDGSTDNNDE